MAHIDNTSAAAASRPQSLHSTYAQWGKRWLDVILAVSLLPILVPVIALLWFLARRDEGPGFFGHERIGREGKMFRCFKIRTMVSDAETRLATHLATNAQAAREWAYNQKLSNDPRITPLGRFLRRTSLDELPQIWNVLKGDMSLVGPRPVTRAELDRYGPYKGVYLSLRPGVTGLWQIEGRENGCYEQRLAMDRRYADNIALARDIRLIVRTSLVVLRPTGR